LHPKTASPTADIAHLKAKCDADACRVIMQLFFEADVDLRFRDRCVGAGIGVPIVPGVPPVTRLLQLD
jgi:methylenetetrahydrofolate reductase (NADPH)